MWNERGPAARQQQHNGGIEMNRNKKLAVAGIGATAALAVGAALFAPSALFGVAGAIASTGEEDVMQKDLVTVHEVAVAIAEVCYDDEDGSDGVTMPGTRSFDNCVDGMGYMIRDEMRRNDVEIIDAVGDPVSYTGFPTRISMDVDAWITPEWKP